MHFRVARSTSTTALSQRSTLQSDSCLAASLCVDPSAGGACNGQVLVLYDLLGLDNGFNPKFLKKYIDMHSQVVGALGDFADEVRDGVFPALAHSHH